MTTILNFFTNYADYIALVTISLPILFSLFMAKRYNFFHGVVCFILSSYLVIYLMELNIGGLADKIYPTLSNNVLTVVQDIPNFFSLLLGKIPTVGKYFVETYKYSNHTILGVYVVIFIISQVISQVFRNSRVY